MPRERSPFSLFKRGKQYYARFWSETEQKYVATRATGATNKAQAGRIAKEMLDAGAVVPRSKDPLFLDVLTEYWADPPDPVTEQYRERNAEYVTRVTHWPEAKNLRLSKLSRAALYRLQDWLKAAYGARTVNRIMQAVSVPIRYSFERDRILIDPTAGLRPLSAKPKQKGSYTAAEVRAFIAWEGETRVKALVLLGALAGLRRGEARALRWEAVDLKAGTLRVEASYTDKDGLSTPKAGSRRAVVIHPALCEVLKALRKESPYTAPEDFVVPNANRGVPVAQVTVARGFRQIVSDIGIDEATRKARGLDFHGLRRTFVTHARQALPDYAVQSMAGHATARMTREQYTDTRIIDLAEYRERFSGMFAEPDEKKKSK